MTNPTQSPAETNVHKWAHGYDVCVACGRTGLSLRQEQQATGKGGCDAWLLTGMRVVIGDTEHKGKTGIITREWTDGYITVEVENPDDGLTWYVRLPHDKFSRVSPAAAVSDLCDACGKPRESDRKIMLVDSIKAFICKHCDTNGPGHPTWSEAQEMIRTRRRSLAEPGFRLGDEVETTTSGYRGKITSVKASHHYGVDGCGQYHSTELRLIRRAPTEAARTGEAWEPKVGEMCEGNGVDDGAVLRGKFLRIRGDTAELEDPDDIPWIVTRASLRPLPPATAGGERCGHLCPDGRPCESPAGHPGRHMTSVLIHVAAGTTAPVAQAVTISTASQPKLDASGFLDRAYLDEQREKATPSRDAARLRAAMPSKHHQALAALSAKSRKPRYAETSRVFSTATWEEDS